MKRYLVTAAVLAVAAGLAACGKKEAAAPAAAPEAAAPAAASSDMASMPTGEAKMAKATGTVTAVDADAGTITLDHAPIPEVNWPAMTMSFKAGPDITKAAKVGDKVSFDVKIQGGAGEVTAIQKQ